MSVIVIPYTVPKSTYNRQGRLIEQKGDIVVSHGFNIDTDKTVILPCEPFSAFVASHCYYDKQAGEYFLK